MKNLLETINIKVNDPGGALDPEESQRYRLKYRACSKKPISNGLNQSGQRAKRVGSKNQNPET